MKAGLLARHRYRWHDAASHVATALRLNPHLAEAHWQQAQHVLAPQGRFADAEVAQARATTPA